MEEKHDKFIQRTSNYKALKVSDHELAQMDNTALADGYFYHVPTGCQAGTAESH